MKRGATSTLGVPGLLPQPRLLLSSARPPPGNVALCYFLSVWSILIFFLAFCVYLVVSFQASSLSLEAALSTSTGMAQKRIRSPQVVPLGPVFPLHQPWGGMPAP